MCIIFTNFTARPDDETLIRAENRNADGIGLAWRQDGLVHWEKGLKIKDLMLKLHDDPPAFPYVIHFRVATSGGKHEELCHPFAVTAKASTSTEGRAKAVLFHNGSWSGWQQEVKQVLLEQRLKTPDGRWSDSRAMAFLASYYGPNIFNLLDMGGQRIVYFSNTELLRWGSWEHKEGWSASNPSFQSYGQSNLHGLNIQSDEEWMRNGRKWDPDKKEFVAIPISRRPVDPEKGKGAITVIKDSKIVSEEAGGIITAESPTGWTKQELTKVIFKLRIFATRMGYSVEKVRAA